MVCSGTQCKKRESCYMYEGNCYDGKTHQLIEWSKYGSGSIGVNPKTGEQFVEQSWHCGDLSDNYPLFKEHVFDRPKDLEEVREFIYEALKRRYGNHVTLGSESIVVYTDTYFHGNNDVWISMNYFH